MFVNLQVRIVVYKKLLVKLNQLNYKKGCQAIDSPYNMETELFNNYLGRIRKLSQIDLLSKSYIHLEADQAIQTMVICIPNQNLTSDIEVSNYISYSTI